MTEPHRHPGIRSFIRLSSLRRLYFIWNTENWLILGEQEKENNISVERLLLGKSRRLGIEYKDDGEENTQIWTKAHVRTVIQIMTMFCASGPVSSFITLSYIEGPLCARHHLDGRDTVVNKTAYILAGMYILGSTFIDY